jgi:ADP-ribose pyrophosphatase
MARAPELRFVETPDVAIERAERVWQGRFAVDVVAFRQRRFDGAMSGTRTWEFMRRGRAAALVPYDPVRDVVVLIEQFRFPAYAAGLMPVMVELPAGLCDGDETPEETIAREMQEEMGLSADRVERMGDFLLTPGGADELCTIFVGRVRAPEDAALATFGLADEQEDIRRRVWPAAEAEAAAIAGQFQNAVTSLGLLWLAARRPALRKKWLQGGLDK